MNWELVSSNNEQLGHKRFEKIDVLKYLFYNFAKILSVATKAMFRKDAKDAKEESLLGLSSTTLILFPKL